MSNRGAIVDLFCGGGCGAVGWHGRAWEFLARSIFALSGVAGAAAPACAEAAGGTA